jgi:hypothetical protein
VPSKKEFRALVVKRADPQYRWLLGRLTVVFGLSSLMHMLRTTKIMKVMRIFDVKMKEKQYS